MNSERNMPNIGNNLKQIVMQIQDTAKAANRDPETVKLVAVGKTKPVSYLKEAARAGAAIIGENYIQEAREKFDQMAEYPVSWHFIGHLQTNKAKYAVRMFDLIHTVDSLKLAVELDKRAGRIQKKQNILLQVNISGERSKDGLNPDHTYDLICEIASLDHIAIRGLMTIPPYFHDPEKSRPFFRELKQLRDRIWNKLDTGQQSHVSLEALSMGMTGDFKVAIEEGATLVRIGTAIFGHRT